MTRDYRLFDQVPHAINESSRLDAAKMSFDPDTKLDPKFIEEESKLIDEREQLDIFVYGYPIVEQDAVLYHYHNRIQKLLEISELSKEEQEDFILKPLRGLFTCVHLVPASKKHHHRGIGGLFEHSLECAINAAELVKKSRFYKEASKQPEEIHAKRWMVAAILGGLFHDAAKVTVDAEIYTALGPVKYYKGEQRLMDWLTENIGLGGIYIARWHSKPLEHDKKLAEMLESLNVIDESIYQWLGEHVSKELKAFFKNSKSVLSRVIEGADRQSIDLNMKQGQFMMASIPGYDQEAVNFVEMAKRLLYWGSKYQKNGEAREFTTNGMKVRGWTINTPESAFVVNEEGAFILCSQLDQLIKAFEICGVPTDLFEFKKKTSELGQYKLNKEKDKLISHLLAANCILPCNDSPIWEVKRIDPDTKEPYGWSYKAIRLHPSVYDRIINYKKPLTERTRPYGKTLSPKQKPSSEGDSNEPSA